MGRHFMVDAFFATFWPWRRCKGFPILFALRSRVFLITCFDWHLVKFMIHIYWPKISVKRKLGYLRITQQCFWCHLKRHFPWHLPFVIVTLALPWLWPLPLCDFRESSSCFICWRTIK
jgi:hypothetical protein